MNVCFVGHRKLESVNDVTEELDKILLSLIEKDADCFMFGNKSEFNTLCWERVTALKRRFPYIRRIYVRSSFENIDETYKKYLEEYYEETYFPQKIRNAGKLSYVERNFEMIDKSDVCVFYFNTNYNPPSKSAKSSVTVNIKSNSGTKIAYNYAVSKKKNLINLYHSNK